MFAPSNINFVIRIYKANCIARLRAVPLFFEQSLNHRIDSAPHEIQYVTVVLLLLTVNIIILV